MRKVILSAASILALGIGSAGVSIAADTSVKTPNTGSYSPSTTNPNTGSYSPSATNPNTGSYSQSTMNPSKDEVRQAQQQLQGQGFYRGQIDGTMGRETKQAIEQFQKKNNLNETAMLDQPTMDKLLGNTGSSGSPTVYHGTGSTTNPQPAAPGTSGLGAHSVPRQ